MLHQTEMKAQIKSKSESLLAELTAESDTFILSKKQELQDAATAHLRSFEAELQAKTEDEIQKIKSKSKTTIMATKEEGEARELSLAIRTPKASKPSPLNISKPKKKKKKVTVLDLTTPSPGHETTASGNNTDMDTDADSTPTTPVHRSSAPSPAPLPALPSPYPAPPDIVPLSQANPESIPHWTRTPSPDDRTPHAPTFAAPSTPAIPSDALSSIMAAIEGLKTHMVSEIGKVNARIDESIAPTNIADYTALELSNLAAYEQPAYIDPPHDQIMEDVEAANAARFAMKLRDESHFRTLLLRLIAERRVMSFLENDYYIDQWNDTCAGICRSLHLDPTAIPETAVESILNAWSRLTTVLNEDEYKITTTLLHERITGVKPDTSTPEGRARWTAFTNVYNEFCATNNHPAHEGFPESQDQFFKYVLANGSDKQPSAPPPKEVRFASAPPIATLSAPSSQDDFPVLRAPSQEPISYASAAGAFIPVTRRRRGKPTTTNTTTNTSTPAPTKPGPAPSGPKPIRPVKPNKPNAPTKPPLPDALKTTKYTIILDHTNPAAKSLYAMDTGSLTRGLQTHLETVKAPLVLLAGAWSAAPFYKNFILTFSGIVNFTDITKYNSVLFGPFGSHCRAAPTAGYQSVLISGVRLQKDAQGKLASPKMLYDELCCNPIFVGRLPLAAPRWLFNPDKLLESDKEASSITFSFHDPTGEGLELMRRSRVGMFGKLVSIRSWEARPLLSQCTRCLRLGHTVERCRRHKDLVVCSKCGGAHQDALHHFNCPHANKHKGRGCDCPPSCFLCIAQGNPKAAQGHTSTSASCPIRKHFRTPTPVAEPTARQCSSTIPPTPATGALMTVLTSDQIKQFSAEGMAVDNITCLLVPPEVAALATTSTHSDA